MPPGFYIRRMIGLDKSVEALVQDRVVSRMEAQPTGKETKMMGPRVRQRVHSLLQLELR